MLRRTACSLLSLTPVWLRKMQPIFQHPTKHTDPHWRQETLNVNQVPHNYPYPGSKYRNKIFQMKKHKALKRWRFNRYKIAALANMPFNKKIRLHMLPELLKSGGLKGDSGKLGDVDTDAEGMAAMMAMTRGEDRTSATADINWKKPPRPQSKYET